MPIKNVKFKFPVAFDGSSVYEVLTPSSTTDETVVLLARKEKADFEEKY